MKLLNFLGFFDSIFTMAGYCLMMGVLVWFVMRPAVASVWFLARPFAVLFGHVPRTAYDFLVAAWKAERRGEWADALAAYDRALDLEPKDADARQRRDSLIAAHPELAGGGEMRAVTPPSTPTSSSAPPWRGR